MYFDKNFQTKKAAKEALAAALAAGQPGLPVYQPGGYFPAKTDGTATCEGPHYPQPHRWYATVTLVDGYAVSIK